jgi:signal recognition particle GTPase
MKTATKTVEGSQNRVVLLGMMGEGQTTACCKKVTKLENVTQGLGLGHILCKDQYKDQQTGQSRFTENF